MATSGHEVDEGEDEDPDEVDEAPVQPEELDVVSARVATEVLREDGEDVEDANEHVEAVVAGDGVEGAGAGGPPEDQPLVQAAPAPTSRTTPGTGPRGRAARRAR